MIKVALCFLMIALGGHLARSATMIEYKLSPGDIVTFDFLDDAEVPVPLTVASDGEVQFPLIGGVRIAGLSVAEALDRLNSEYRARKILNDPKIALNVTTVRPIFVLGEVKNPGSFPFHPGLTVEQAIGLAGGTQTDVTNPSDKIVARARLRGEIYGADSSIIHEAAYAARLVAQLQKKPAVDLKDAPDIARNFLQNVSLKPVLEIEQRILDTDLRTTQSQVEILTKGIAEAEQGLEILKRLEVEQKEVVDLNVADLERVSALRKRELNTVTDLMRSKTTTSNEKARLLEIYAEMSRSRRELGNLRLELAKLQADRENDILLKIQERYIAIKKLLATRQAAEEQYFLLSAVTLEDSSKNKISFGYQIRREVDSKPAAITATPLTAVLPGDVVTISLAGI
jgi:exopolysaccharide production protein ExoF